MLQLFCQMNMFFIMSSFSSWDSPRLQFCSSSPPLPCLQVPAAPAPGPSGPQSWPLAGPDALAPFSGSPSAGCYSPPAGCGWMSQGTCTGPHSGHSNALEPGTLASHPIKGAHQGEALQELSLRLDHSLLPHPPSPQQPYIEH